MHRSSIRILFRLALPAVLSLAVFALGRPQVLSPQVATRGLAPIHFLSRMAIPGTSELQLIIELTDPPVIRALAALSPGGAAAASAGGVRNRMDLASAQALSYRAQLVRAQQAVTDRLNGMNGVQVQAATDLVMNAIVARVPMDRYLEIRNLPGVRKVHFSRPQRKNLDTSAVLLNAPGLWARAGSRSNAGLGMKIGLIDTGIDINNPMFADTTTELPAGFPKGEAAFTNRKVIVARNYVNLLPIPQSVRTAIDEDGHGTFVAGCAAGKFVTAPLAQISGMAPGAFLGSYKVFGTPGINDFTSTAAILTAINAAVADGMDVLNLSLGSLDYLPSEEDPEVTAISNAISAGVVVVLAAGNNGPETHTISSPATAPPAIAVGAVSNSRVYGSQLHVTGPAPVPTDLQNLIYRNGTGPVISAVIPDTNVVDVLMLDGNGLACSALPSGSLSGKIALIERGECTFAAKVGNAAIAGANAVVVYNNVPGESPITMGNLGSTTIPAVMISYSDGVSVQSFVSANPGATIRIDVSTNTVLTPTTPDELTSFSSRGPSSDFVIKPDLVAVGENVYSATQINFPNQGLYDASQFTTGSGTSFSAPMVSGAAAAVKALFPSLTPAGIKSALVNTANQNVTTDGTTPASIVQVGGGLLDMGKAAGAGAVFAPASLNFGMQSYSNAITLTQTLAITNTSGSTDQYALSVRPVVAGPAVGLGSTSTGSVAPGATANVLVSVQASAPLSGGFQGYIAVQSAQTGTVYTVPYWAGLYVPDSSRVLTVSQNSSLGNAYRTLSAALAAAQPGNIIEIADSKSYLVGPDGITISTNAQGLPLHGLTIRAAAGQTPVLDGTVTQAPADIQIIGVRNVLLQGLTINGGETGVDILQPSTSLPTSVAIDHCAITNMNVNSASTGIFVENGGQIDVTYSTIAGSSSTGIVVLNGAQFTLSNSTLQGNQEDAVEAFDSNVDLIDSTFTGNAGVGAYLVNCTGTVTRNTFTGNTSIFGDGVDLLDGSMTISDNIFKENESTGVYLVRESFSTLGSTAIVERNTMQSNGEFGIYCSPVRNLRMSGNMLKDNGTGVVIAGSSKAVLVNNIIVRSTRTTYGNGIEVRDATSLQVVNNTIYGNQEHGISRFGAASVAVLNSIISGNLGGDLLGVLAETTQYSLIGSGTIAGTGTNIQGNPKFKSPDTDDFSLGDGSPAIDAGTNAAANLPFLDFAQQLRVASSGAAPGTGTVDMGALEAGSSYPLNYPLLVSGINATMNDTYVTGIAALNPSTTTATAATFTGYDPAGALLSGSSNPSTWTFAPEVQGAKFDWELFSFPRGAVRTGSVLTTSLQKLVGFFLIFDPLLSRVADGVDVSSDTWTDFYFLRHQSDASGQASYQLFNPGVNPANVTVSLFGTSGSMLAPEKTSAIPPKGQFMFNFNNVASSSGYVHIQSDFPITGLETWGSTAEIAALRAASTGTEARLYFPHIAVNGGYSSILGVVNTSNVITNLTLTAYAEDGSVMGAVAQRAIPANGQLLESASSLFGFGPGNLRTGYVVISADQPGINGFCSFNYDSGNVHSVAAVPSQSIPQPKLVFSHIANQVADGAGGNYLTGVALLNPYGTPINYTMRVFNGAGVEVAKLTSVLGPHAKIAKLLSYPIAGSSFFTQPLVLSGGHIEVTTDYQLMGFELFFTQSLTQLAAVMAQVPD